MNSFKLFLIVLCLLTLVCCRPTDDFDERVRKSREEYQQRVAEMDQKYNNEMTQRPNSQSNFSSDTQSQIDQTISNNFYQYEKAKEEAMKEHEEKKNNIMFIFIGIIGGILVLGVVGGIVVCLKMGKARKRIDARIDQAIEDRREFMKNGGIIEEHYHYGYGYH